MLIWICGDTDLDENEGVGDGDTDLDTVQMPEGDDGGICCALPTGGRP